jgi:hypothetical protein
MWWPEKSACFPWLLRLAVAMTAAGMTAGCFQPLYGDHSLTGGPGILDKMGSVEVLPVDAPAGTPVARIGVETRNQLIYDLTGGGGTISPAHGPIWRITASTPPIPWSRSRRARPCLRAGRWHASPTIFPVRSNVSLARAVCAMPRTRHRK